ncbi:hypothetical protein [Nocardioides convexus]|uniref:hypothetical protein n=1 Tax=Nocardioides convexus TaxID=2712224 RepID=UPI0024186748|nr:hypothetical protein [Nocardioides convexus]
MVREVKSAPLLFGYRGAEAVDVAAIEDLITRVAEPAERPAAGQPPWSSPWCWPGWTAPGC